MLMHMMKSFMNHDSNDNWMRQALHNRVMRRYPLIVIIAISTILILTGSAGYCYTMTDVDNAVAAATTGYCSGEKRPNGQKGYDIVKKCLIPTNTLAVYGIFMGNDCLDGYGNHFSGGPGAGGGCNGSYSTWAYACDNTLNGVSITPTTTVYRECWQSSVTVLCDGTEIINRGGYIDLGLDCSYMTKSPCPWSINNSEDSCYSTTVTTISPVCDDSDSCCGSNNPCCDSSTQQCCPGGPSGGDGVGFGGGG